MSEHEWLRLECVDLRSKLATATKELSEAKEKLEAVVEAIDTLSDSIDPRYIKRLLNATKGR